MLAVIFPTFAVGSDVNATITVQNGSSVYTEDFSTYSAAEYVEKVNWGGRGQALQLAYIDSAAQSNPAVAVDNNDNAIVVWTDNRDSYDGIDNDIYVQKVNSNGSQLWADDIRVHLEANAEQNSPAVTVDSDSNAVVVWEDNRNGMSDSDIYAQKIDGNGSQLWTVDLRVNSEAEMTRQYSPAVATDSNGDTVVVWVDYYVGESGIQAQKLSGSGSRMWAADMGVGFGEARSEHPAVAADGSGNAVVVWVDYRSGHPDIYAQKLNANGSRVWATDLRVNSEAITKDQFSPAVTVDSSGNAIVVWIDTRNSDYDIYAQKIDANGSKLWTADLRINSDTDTISQYYPAVSVDTNGNTVVVWQESRNGKYYIYAQRIDGNGDQTWIDDVRVNSDAGTAGQSEPAVAVDSSGSAVVVWDDTRNGNQDIYAEKINGSGSQLWAADLCVNSDTGTADQKAPALAVDGNGNSMAVWQNYYDANCENIYSQKVDSSGSRLWATGLQINAETGVTNDAQLAVAVDNKGNFVTVWDDYRNGNWDIYAQELDNDGNQLWVSDLRVNVDTGTTSQRYPAVAIDDSNNAVVVWQDGRNGNFDIYAQKIDTSGSHLWATDLRVNVHAAGTALRYLPAVSIDSSGNAMAVWSDYRNGNADVYAQKLNSTGSHLWAADLRVDSDTGTTNQWNPTLAMDSNGNAVVVWDDSRNGSYDNLYAQKISSGGSKLWATDIRVNADTGAKTLNWPSVAVDSSGSAVITWHDNRNGNSDVYAQKLDGSGSLLWATDLRVNSDSGTIDQCCSAVAVDSSGVATVMWQDPRNGNNDIYAQKINSVGSKAWIDDLQVVYSNQFHFPTGTAQSRTVDTLSGAIRQATLTADYQSNGGSVQFYLTNDGGTTWAPVTPGVSHAFTSTGSDLRWKAVLNVDPVWNRTPIVHSLRIDYSTQLPYADTYEPDDTCAQAHAIQPNDAVQAHTFHQQADADWAWFDVISGTTYIIQTSDTQANANTELELHDACTQPPFAFDDNAFGQDAHITWKASFSGPVYVQVANHDPAIYGADTGYDLSVRTLTQPPVVVIIAGHDNGYSLQSNIDAMADMAYRTFLNSGVPKSNIRYFGPRPARDVDGNGLYDDLYATVTVAGVRDAVQNWAQERGVKLGVPFYLYLVDHGYYDQFLAAGSSSKIQATDLNLWLSNLEEKSGTDNINVILEACKSGSFIDVTTPGPAHISGRNRVIIASTSSRLNAYASTQGGHFSDAFWTAIGQNQDLKTAFAQAKQAVQATELSQQPWLDDNGDTVADGKDGSLAQNRGLGGAFAGSPPVIDWVAAEGASGQATLQAQVRDDFGVARVWAEVYAPDFVEPEPSPDGTTPVVDVLTTTLTLAGSDLYGVTYPLMQTGEYRMVIYAQDDEGNQALPQAVRVSPGSRAVYLPLVVRNQ